MKYFEKRAEFFRNRLEDLKFIANTLDHKMKVYAAGRVLGVPVGQLLMHDSNKFDPTIGRTYAEFFNGDRGVKGTRDPLLLDQFRAITKFHRITNPHHTLFTGVKEHYTTPNQLEAIADHWAASLRHIKPGEKIHTLKEFWAKAKPSYSPGGSTRPLPLSPEAVAIIEDKIKNLK